MICGSADPEGIWKATRQSTSTGAPSAGALLRVDLLEDPGFNEARNVKRAVPRAPNRLKERGRV